MRVSPLFPCRPFGNTFRRLALEALEERRLLEATPWHNSAMPFDVNQSGTVSVTDALAVISDMLTNGVRVLAPPDPDPPFFYIDTNADNKLTPRDAMTVVSRILNPPRVEISTLVPFSVDVSPLIDVTATSLGGFPTDAQVKLDVDLNNDGDFTDLTEAGRTLATLFEGNANFTIDPALPASLNGAPYTVRLRARVTDNDGMEGRSAIQTLIIDTELSGALHNYVNTFDASYHYSLANTIDGPGFTYYVLDMTSQTWRSAAEVNKPQWRHWVDVIVPDFTPRSTALLLIDGGSNNFGAPASSLDEEMTLFGQVAVAVGSVFVRIRVVPNEPVIFSDETRTRSEDEIIAYTFDKYMEHLGQPGNETWPLLLPMAKSAVRAMDTVQNFVPTVSPTQINDFVVTGYSKRGWTTWMTAAVDDRVRAIIPGVIDVLNQGPQMVHHYGVYGFFSDAIFDYNEMEIFHRIMTPEGQLLSRIVDPYRYLHNGKFDDMPKLLLNSAGDEFFVSDSAQYYFHDLPGEYNYLRYFPNTGHGLDLGAVSSTLSFFAGVLAGEAFPKFSWTVEPDGALRVQVDQSTGTPSLVRMWQATNPVARDFRRAWNPLITWTSSLLTDQGGGMYVGNPAMPDAGARAYFVELTYASTVPGVPHVFTTEIHVKSTLDTWDWPFDSGFPSGDSLIQPAVVVPDGPNFALAQPALGAVASGLAQPASFDAPAGESVTSAAGPAVIEDEAEQFIASGASMAALLYEASAITPSAAADDAWQEDLLDASLELALDEILA